MIIGDEGSKPKLLAIAVQTVAALTKLKNIIERRKRQGCLKREQSASK